jgi:hypothetical protein
MVRVWESNVVVGFGGLTSSRFTTDSRLDVLGSRIRQRLDFLVGQLLTAFQMDPQGGHLLLAKAARIFDCGGGGALHLSPTAARSIRCCEGTELLGKCRDIGSLTVT